MDLTVLTTIQTLPFPLPHSVYIPGIGSCASYSNPHGVVSQSFVSCNSTLPSARLLVVMFGKQGSGFVPDFAPYPHSVGYSPLTPVASQFSFNGPVFDIHDGRPPEMHLEIQKPIAYIQRPFDFQGIRLSDYAMEPSSVH